MTELKTEYENLKKMLKIQKNLSYNGYGCGYTIVTIQNRINELEKLIKESENKND